MSGSLDLHGIFSTLERGGAPAPADPLEAWEISVAVARERMRIFDPACTTDPVPQTVAPRGRRADR